MTEIHAEPAAPATDGRAAYEAFHAARWPGDPGVGWTHPAVDKARPAWAAAEQASAGQIARERDELRASYDELNGIHTTLLEEILKNADEDITSAEEAPEYLAEAWVRFLERERDNLRARLAGTLSPEDADRDRYADVLHRIASGSIPAAGAAQSAYDALDGATPGPDTLAAVVMERDRLAEQADRLSRQLAAAVRGLRQIAADPDDGEAGAVAVRALQAVGEGVPETGTAVYPSAIAPLFAALRRLADPEWLSSGRDIGFGGEMEARRALAVKALADADRVVPSVTGYGPSADALRAEVDADDAKSDLIGSLHDLVRDILQSDGDTTDIQEWRDRAGALGVADPDGKPYRAYTEDDL